MNNIYVKVKCPIKMKIKLDVSVLQTAFFTHDFLISNTKLKRVPGLK